MKDFNRWAWRTRVAPLLLVAAIVLAAFAAYKFLWGTNETERNLRMSAGSKRGTRNELAEFLVERSEPRQLHIELIETSGSVDTLRRVDAGEIDLALVQGGLEMSEKTNVRQLAALYVEPLHLLVREGMYDAVKNNFGALRGRRINLSTAGSGTNLLAREVLEFGGLRASSSDGSPAFEPSTLGHDAILSRLDKISDSSGDRRQQLIAELPDAFFLVATMPSLVAKRLAQEAGYRLVSLPFGEAFGLVSVEEETGDKDRIAQLHLKRIKIPKFTYGVVPPVPSEPCLTIGTRLLLISHKDVPADVVTRVLPLIYEGAIEKLYDLEPLDEVLPEYALHKGAIEYRSRNKPIVRSEIVNTLQRLAAVGGPLLGAALALYGFWRWRQVLRFESYFREVLRLKMLAKGIQLDEEAAPVEGNRRQYLEAHLDELQRRAIYDFSRGYFRGEGVIFNLMSLISDTRQTISQLEPDSAAAPVPNADEA